MKKTVLLFTLIITLGNITACTHDFSSQVIDDDPRLSPSPLPTALKSYESCDALLAEIQADAVAELEANPYGYIGCYYYDEAYAADAGSAGEGGSAAETDYTDTNTQEKDVDEDDIVKTDGRSIYVVTTKGVDIFKAWPLNDFTKIGSYTEDRVSGLFLHDSHLILLSAIYDETRNNVNRVKVTMLDVSNPASPTLVRAKLIDGRLIKARRVDNVLHLALSHLFRDSSTVYPTVDWDSEACMGDEAALEAATSAYRNAILATTIEDWLPLHGDGNTDTPMPCTGFAHDEISAGNPVIGLASLDLESDSYEENFTFVKGSGYQAYASTRSFYIASSNTDTMIHRFALETESDVELHRYVASGTVPGTIKNSFSMGENKTGFNIATTAGHLERDGSSTVYNNLYILDKEDSALPILGKIENIAPGESIYAARFIGDRGYLVTYHKIDPLHVIDLSDPSAPSIIGELEMPGYSTYLHPLGETHIIGLGKDAELDESGTFSWYQGLKLAVFDVENAPSIVEDLVIGDRGTDSKALYDHHAFTLRSDGLLALPLSLYEGSSGGDDYGDFMYNGVHLYTLSENGIDERGQVVLPSDAHETPQRTVMIGSGNEQGLYILDDYNLYLVNLSKGYTVEKTESLDTESYEYYAY